MPVVRYIFLESWLSYFFVLSIVLVMVGGYSCRARCRYVRMGAYLNLPWKISSSFAVFLLLYIVCGRVCIHLQKSLNSAFLPCN